MVDETVWVGETQGIVRSRMVGETVWVGETLKE